MERVDAPALGFSITANIEGDRQIVVQSFVPLDAEPGDIDALLDKVMRRLDRQKAYYEVEAVAAEAAKIASTLSQFEEDLSRVGANFERARAQREIELDERRQQRAAERLRVEAEIDGQLLDMNGRRDAEFTSGMDEARRGGRLGEYKPTGSRKRNIELIDAQIENVRGMKIKALEEFEAGYDAALATAQAEIDKMDGQEAADMQNLSASIKRHKEELAIRQERLHKLQAILKG